MSFFAFAAGSLPAHCDPQISTSTIRGKGFIKSGGSTLPRKIQQYVFNLCSVSKSLLSGVQSNKLDFRRNVNIDALL